MWFFVWVALEALALLLIFTGSQIFIKNTHKQNGDIGLRVKGSIASYEHISDTMEEVKEKIQHQEGISPLTSSV